MQAEIFGKITRTPNAIRVALLSTGASQGTRLQRPLAIAQPFEFTYKLSALPACRRPACRRTGRADSS
ncbi:MAG: hypothetical protein DRH24_04795 [Deltaproteobacteria bacterium]|nr:MAG: hypothetical protein DRH24_04795 [Deltaproteobacteria bacterium]